MRHQENQAPKAVNHTRHRGQQINDVAEALCNPTGCVEGDEERHTDSYRDRKHQSDERGEDRAKRQGRDAELGMGNFIEPVGGGRGGVRIPLLVGEEVSHVLLKSGQGFHHQEDGDGGKKREQEPARHDHEPPEDLVLRFAPA